MNALAASDVLKMQYKGDAGTKTYVRRFLFVTPIRYTP
jgi:hypothetical protein